MNPRKIYVLSHANCYDGTGAVYAAKKKFGDDAIYRYCNYAECDRPLREVPDGAEVYVLDFSFKREVILEHRKRLSRLTVIDHHKTAEADLSGLDDTIFDMTKSGALLSWEYFHPDVEVPELIRHISDRDLWKFEIPYTKEIHAALQCYSMDPDVWDKLLVANLKVLGHGVLLHQAALVEKICEKADLLDIGGHLVPIANTSVFFSEVAHKLIELYPEAPFAAYYYDYPQKGSGWIKQVGLRSESDFDVSEVAKKFGGGGHKSAAGFIIRGDLSISEYIKSVLTKSVAL